MTNCLVSVRLITENFINGLPFYKGCSKKDWFEYHRMAAGLDRKEFVDQILSVKRCQKGNTAH